MKKLSLVVPVYFEQEVILQFLKETKEVLDQLPVTYEYVFVDDGSKDDTVKIIKEQAALDARIKLVVFSYNHGKASAISAAIAHASGDYLLYMDPDLQDPPVEIPRFLEEIEEKIAKAMLLKQQEIEKLKEYKTVLIDNVVTGRMRVS